MCTSHTHADGHSGERAADPASGCCGHCSGADPQLEELEDLRDPLDRDIEAWALGREGATGLHQTA